MATAQPPDADQQGTESEKRQAHTDVVAAYVAAHNERIDLQMAADQIWGFFDPAKPRFGPTSRSRRTTQLLINPPIAISGIASP